jgi:curved DNA-binding protein CbpA/predicted ABC-type ATPase
MGMTEKMVGNIVKRYARWRDSNAPIETASIKHALMKYANSLTPGENRLMGRIADGESVYDFASRMNMPRKSAVRMYNSAMRKLHIESKVAPKSRVFSANIFKAAPKRWISPVMPADIFAKTRAISGRMGNESTAINNIKQSNAFNESERAFTSAPMNVLREMALDVRQELRDQVAELTQTSAEMHPVLGGHDGVKKMATLGAYISRTLENARITALLDEYKTAKTKFIPRERREAVEAKALLDATKNLSEELWLKKQMMDLAANIYDSYEKASWPWRQWDSSSPEWKRHLGVFETMEMYKIDTPSGRRKYINDGYYMPLTPREMEAFFEAVNTNNGITGKMSNPRQWARSRDLYEILGVPDTASPEDLKKAFRTKSRELHPDVNKRADADEQFKELGFAWETLSNSSLKAQYDSWRRRNTSGAGADDEVDNFKVDDNMYITDERGRLWLRHNADRDDWPTVPFTENTVFPQRKWTEQEFDEWSDWTSHKIQPSRPAGSALWGERGPGDDIRAGRGTGFEGGGGDFSPQDFEQQLRDEGVQFWDERTMGPPPNPNDFPGSGGFPSAQGSIAGRMSNFSPLDDSTRQRLGIGDLPSLYDQQQLTAQYPKDTAMFYAAKPGEPAIEVTTTFGGKLNLAQHRYDNVYRPIIDAMINAVRQNKRGRKRFISVGGPAGSGKTTDRKTGAHGIPVVEDALHVDADEIKTLIPEARALHAAGNPQWAGAVHEESRIIADLALQEAIANGLDVVYDSTGQYNSGFGTLQAARNAGYDIVMHYNTAEPDALAAAIESRSQTDSRRLPTGFNNAVMQRNKTIMPSVAKAADEFYLWDSSDIKSRKLLAQKQTPQSMLQIMDPNAYVYGNFDEAGQAITKGGRPTARLNQYRYAAESPEGRAIRAFENGSTIDQISEEMPEMKRDRIFDVVTGGVIDPTLQYRPPAAPSQRPAINPEKKIDDFVSDDNLESIWNSLEEAQQQIVRNVLNKQPGAMDEFDDSGMPMDIIIWAAQNNISGKMGAVYDRDRYSASDVSDAILDVYGRGLQIAEMLEALKKDYDISMGRVDLTARITRLRKAGKLDTYRLPNKKQTARKIKKSATQKFIDKRDNQIIRLAKTRPNLTANEIAAIINSMPIPPGVAVQRMSASSVSRIVNKKGK